MTRRPVWRIPTSIMRPSMAGRTADSPGDGPGSDRSGRWEYDVIRKQVAAGRVAGWTLATVDQESGRPPASGRGAEIGVARALMVSRDVNSRCHGQEQPGQVEVVTIGLLVQR